MTGRTFATSCAAVMCAAMACRQGQPAPARAGAERARHLILVTVDTLRADRVGAYGYAGARTPTFDAVAHQGARFDRAYAAAPITLTSHASLLTGRYPAGHGARHNGMAMREDVPTLATTLKAAGFATGAFVSAFPLDRRFGLARGFDIYDDVTERGPGGRPLDERPGTETARRARAWLDARRAQRVFLWMHLFEPHAPYGDAASGSKPLSARYDDEIASADRAAAYLLEGLAEQTASTLIILTADHGEAFGEHGEMAHSIFVYDTTLRVPLVMRGPGVPEARTVDTPVSLVDVAPTALGLLGVAGFDADGLDVAVNVKSNAAIDRTIYAESFAPLFDFGWSPLRTVRDATWKYIAAPRPELFNLARDPNENDNVVSADPQRAAQWLARADRYGGAEAAPLAANAETTNRLRSLGYLSGSRSQPSSARPDPKDRVALAARIARVTSGEVRDEELVATLEAILRDDPANSQAHLRLGYAELARGRCAQAEPHFRAAVAAELPSADAALGLADCRMRANDLPGAERALALARTVEPGNPVVEANLGLLALSRGDGKAAIPLFESALARDPGFLEARFNLARALAVAGRRDEARREANAVLAQLPPAAPQRPEVIRLLEALK